MAEIVEGKNMDWETCRVCLENGDIMVSLFDWDDNNEQLSSKYKYCCGVEISQTDGLPTLICVNCVDRMTFSYQFKQQCLAANEALGQCLTEFASNENIEIKEEPLDFEDEIKSVSPKKTIVTRQSKSTKKNKKQDKIKTKPNAKNKSKNTKVKSENSINDKSGDESDGALADFGDDPDFSGDSEDDPEYEETETTPKKRGRPQKKQSKKKETKKKVKTKLKHDPDILLQEAIMAQTVPIAENILNQKVKYKNVGTKRKRSAIVKSHVCDTCGGKFDSNAALQVHIRRHLGIKPFVCSVCDYSCVIKLELKRHMLKHTGEKPYACRLCEKAFSDFGTRQKHERKHMGVRPYVCSVCSKSFTYSDVLKAHMLIHTGEKNFSCEPCDRKFTRAHHLKYHNKIHHKDLYQKMVEAAEAKKARERGLIIQNDGNITHIVKVPVHKEEVVIDETNQAVIGIQEVIMESECY